MSIWRRSREPQAWKQIVRGGRESLDENYYQDRRTNQGDDPEVRPRLLPPPLPPLFLCVCRLPLSTPRRFLSLISLPFPPPLPSSKICPYRQHLVWFALANKTKKRKKKANSPFTPFESYRILTTTATTYVPCPPSRYSDQNANSPDPGQCMQNTRFSPVCLGRHLSRLGN